MITNRAVLRRQEQGAKQQCGLHLVILILREVMSKTSIKRIMETEMKKIHKIIIITERLIIALILY